MKKAKELIVTMAAAKYLTVDQKAFDDHMRRSLELAFENGKSKSEIEQIRLEWQGGPCQKCGKEYKSFHVEMERLAGNCDYVYYTPACGCKTDLESAEEEAEIYAKLVSAGVPPIYRDVTVDTWDRDVEAGTNGAFDRVREYIASREYHSGRGNILFGAVGTGKTRSAVCILRALVAEGRRVKYAPMGEALEILMDRRYSKYELMNRLVNHDAVLFDDLDKVAAEQDFIQEKIFRIFDKMISHKKLILGTTNFREVKDFTEKFDESVVSRLVKGCRFTKFVGSDYRMKERRKK